MHKVDENLIFSHWNVSSSISELHSLALSHGPDRPVTTCLQRCKYRCRSTRVFKVQGVMLRAGVVGGWRGWSYLDANYEHVTVASDRFKLLQIQIGHSAIRQLYYYKLDVLDGRLFISVPPPEKCILVLLWPWPLISKCKPFTSVSNCI